jgi:protein SCO1
MTPVLRHLRPALLTCSLLLGSAGVARAEQSPAPAPGPTPAHASAEIPDRYEPVPEKFRNSTDQVAIQERLGQPVRLDLDFVDSTGRNVKLSEFFNKGRPVVLQMGYFRCPQICDVVSAGLVGVAKETDLVIGQDYDVVYVSIDPKERWQLGQEKKRNYVEEYGKSSAITGMHFLVGSEAHIRELANGVGFIYQKVEGTDEWSHPTMLTVLTPDGTVSRYLYGVQFAEKTYRMALIEAGQGKIGNAVDQILMMCFHWDSYQGKYTKNWMAIMRLGAVVSIAVLGTAIGLLFWREHKLKRRSGTKPPSPTGGGPGTLATA